MARLQKPSLTASQASRKQRATPRDGGTEVLLMTQPWSAQPEARKGPERGSRSGPPASARRGVLYRKVYRKLNIIT